MEVIDLCSRDGWFTLKIAKVARHAAAIDIDPTLLEVARVRLMEAGVTNCSTRLWPDPVDLLYGECHSRRARPSAAGNGGQSRTQAKRTFCDRQLARPPARGNDNLG